MHKMPQSTIMFMCNREGGSGLNFGDYVGLEKPKIH